MDANILTEKIVSDPENIIKILNKLGHEKIHDKGRYFQTANLNGDNESAISILKENLVYQNFTRNDKGNIYSLIMYDKGYTFPEALQFAAKCIGYKDDGIKVRPPFGGFYKSLIHNKEKDYTVDLPIYSETDLPDPKNLSKIWMEDGVNLLTQIEYGIRYDPWCDSIIIPVHDYFGNLVGAKKRINKRVCLQSEQRWGMYIPYPKGELLYGWIHNYKTIKEKKTVVIVEAEKSVAQLSSMGYDLGLAIGGHNIYDYQVHYIKSLHADKIIVAFDEGLDEDEIKYETSKLLPINGIYSYKVGYIFDGGCEILERGSKDSPTDRGLKAFSKLYKKHTVWIK